MSRIAQICGAFAFSVIGPSASAATLIPVIPPQGSEGFEVLAINNNNIIAGDYADSTGFHGFFGTLDGNYTTVDYDSHLIEIRGINDKNEMTVISTDSGDECTFLQLVRLPSGKLKLIEKDGTNLDGLVQGINNNGKFVGNFCDSNGTKIGYVGQKASYRKDFSIKIKNAGLFPRGINSAAAIVGTYLDPSGTIFHGFVSQNGKTATQDYPDKSAVNTVLFGVNNAGVAVGVWNAGDYNTHAFVLDSTTDTFKELKIPNSTATYADGINDAGLIPVNSDAGNFIYCPGNEKDCPKAGGDR